MRYRSRAVKAAIGAAVPTLAIALGTGIPATANASSDGQQARTLKGLTCMPKPSACGFPDATNTGVPPGTPLTVVNGTVTLEEDPRIQIVPIERAGGTLTAEQKKFRDEWLNSQKKP